MMLCTQDTIVYNKELYEEEEVKKALEKEIIV